ncbi:unnamed protein product [Acanthoscelides obtectus]|uniref:Uncharacterized protein n=1 Tax=Acanthoscelides obtectus TaxID=200917 RepID=A0A9P0LWI2_ACAOB|nr:unnamed protein product [Acanthoscelides obtectus]CAK1652805.1 hypothetical protein AOBTE_LOCUS17915 [Acanthoscelides obtectus]
MCLSFFICAPKDGSGVVWLDYRTMWCRQRLCILPG